MRFKDRLKRLSKKLPERPEIIHFEWVDPETGKPWYRLILTPDGKGGHSVKEERLKADN